MPSLVVILQKCQLRTSDFCLFCLDILYVAIFWDLPALERKKNRILQASNTVLEPIEIRLLRIEIRLMDKAQ